MSRSDTVFLLKVIIAAILDLPLVALALYYGRTKPGGSDPTLRRALYILAAGLWLAAAIAGGTR